MKAFIRNLSEYNFHTNDKMISSILTNSEKLSEKIIDLMSHTLRAHEIWLNRLTDNNVQLKVWEKLEVDNFEKLNTELFNRTIEIINKKKIRSKYILQKF